MSQTSLKKNTLFAEVGGNGLLFSGNYERQITKFPEYRFRLGIGCYSTDPLPTYILGLNYVRKIGVRNTFLDAGLGATYVDKNVSLYWIVEHQNNTNFENESHLSFIPNIGFRWVFSNNLMWRVSFTPIINQNGFIPYLGFSFGYQFL